MQRYFLPPCAHSSSGDQYTSSRVYCVGSKYDQPLLRPAQMLTSLHTLCSKAKNNLHVDKSTSVIRHRKPTALRNLCISFSKMRQWAINESRPWRNCWISDQLFERSKSVCSAQILTRCSFNWRLTQLMSPIFSFFSSTRSLLTKNFIGDISQIELKRLPIYLKMFLILPLISLSAFAHWANFFSWCPMRLLLRRTLFVSSNNMAWWEIQDCSVRCSRTSIFANMSSRDMSRANAPALPVCILSEMLCTSLWKIRCSRSITNLRPARLWSFCRRFQIWVVLGSERVKPNAAATRPSVIISLVQRLLTRAQCRIRRNVEENVEETWKKMLRM